MGGSAESHFTLLPIKYVPTAPISVARLPKIISGGSAPHKRLERRQPANSPGYRRGREERQYRQGFRYPELYRIFVKPKGGGYESQDDIERGNNRRLRNKKSFFAHI